MFELTNNYFCRSKIRKAVPYSNLAIYDVIIAFKPQVLDLRNQTTPWGGGGESGYKTEGNGAQVSKGRETPQNKTLTSNEQKSNVKYKPPQNLFV